MSTQTVYYNSPSGIHPTSRATITLSARREGVNIIVDANIEATLVYNDGYINYDGEINFNMWIGTNTASANIKGYSDRWAVGTPRTRTRHCSMTFPSLDDNFPIGINMTTPSPNQSFNMAGQTVNLTTDKFVKPTSPTWFNYTPRPCEINQAPLLTWGGAQVGSTGQISYDVVVRSSRPDGSWTDFILISAAQAPTSYQEVPLSQMNVLGQKPFVGVGYQYGIRSWDNGYSNSDAYFHPDPIYPVFNPPSKPSVRLSSNTVKIRTGNITVSWSVSSLGSGSLSYYKVWHRVKIKGTWSVWGLLYQGTNSSYTYPMSHFPNASNGDEIQFKIGVANSWGLYTESSVTPSVVVRGNQMYVKINNLWKEGIPYVKVNNQWKEGVPYIKVGGQWREGT